MLIFVFASNTRFSATVKSCLHVDRQRKMFQTRLTFSMIGIEIRKLKKTINIGNLTSGWIFLNTRHTLLPLLLKTWRRLCAKPFPWLTGCWLSIPAVNLHASLAFYLFPWFLSFFSLRLTTLGRTVAKGHMSVCLSVCHTGDPRLNGSRYRNVFRTILDRRMSLVYWRQFSGLYQRR